MICFLILLIIIILLNIYLYHTFPLYTTLQHEHYDVAIVLGSPTNADGSLSRIQKTRMDKAIYLYQNHHIHDLIVSGGSVRNVFSEAETMKTYAVAHGIPEKHIFIEDKALNTYDNLRYSKKLCEQQGFQSVMVVTSSFHVRRAGFFVKKHFDDFVLVKTDDKEKFKHTILEYIRMWNTLRFEYLTLHIKRISK